jgi:hypothetical protein
MQAMPKSDGEKTRMMMADLGKPRSRIELLHAINEIYPGDARRWISQLIPLFDEASELLLTHDAGAALNERKELSGAMSALEQGHFGVAADALRAALSPGAMPNLPQEEAEAFAAMTRKQIVARLVAVKQQVEKL